MSSGKINSTWTNIGVYPTPKSVVDQFVDFTIGSINGNKTDEMLDMFAGDGRLGISLQNRLSSSRVRNLTLFEARKDTFPKEVLNDKIKTVIGNGFDHKEDNKYDLIVSNPPYLSINAKQAAKFEIDWNHARMHGRNLFSLGISKCIELCKPGGLVAVIAPFGYLRGLHSAQFRQQLESTCSEINILASADRNLFEDASQDIAFQLFKKRDSTDSRKTKWKFGYDKAKSKPLHVALPFSMKEAEKHVRVGPIVWNRKKSYLGKKSKNRLPIIYGGNLTHHGTLSFNVSRYKSKQYISKTAVIPTDLLSIPFIAIRRTLRGKPGEWIVDSTVVTDKTLLCTAENHTIIAELPELPNKSLEAIRFDWIDSICKFYHHSGSPNISTKIAGTLFSSVIKKHMED